MAFKFGGYRVSRNQSYTTGRLIWDVVALVLIMFVGDKVLSAVVSALGQTYIDTTTGFFYQAYKFLGLTSGSTSSLIGLIGLIGAASIIMKAFRVSKM